MTEQRRLLCAFAVLLAFAAAGCGSDGDSDSARTDEPDAPATAKKDKATAEEPAKKPADDSAPTKKTVTLRDPVKDAFTVKVPKGWNTVAYSSGEFGEHREVVNSVSPDGGTVLFVGDPKIPSYYNPETADPFLVQYADTTDFVELQSYVSADEYFAQYTEDKFGALPGFEIERVEDNGETAEKIHQKYAQAGLPVTQAHAVNVYFAYEAEGKTVHGLVSGMTIDLGSVWQADVTGLSTDRSVKEFLPMLSRMFRSKKTNPAFTERMNAEHARVMAQIQAGTDAMTDQHNANMAAIQGSAQRHQQRMNAITAAGDANTAAFENRMDAMDGTQRQFLNYINDEQTVVDSAGQQMQVDDGYDRYFVNKNDNSYVGGDINFDDATIRAMGLNPNDYEEVQPKR